MYTVLINLNITSAMHCVCNAQFDTSELAVSFANSFGINVNFPCHIIVINDDNEIVYDVTFEN